MFQKIRSVAGGVIFLVLCAGGALAMPASFNAESEEEIATVADLPEDLELDGVDEAVQGETIDVTVPDADENDESDENDDSDDAEDSDKVENHGKAVSTAAHCDLKGRAKGQLVSSIARDKSATAATAQAACDAAMAAQAAAPAKVKATKPAKPAKVAKPVKTPKAPLPAKAPKTPKAPKPAPAPVVEDTTTPAAPTAGPPAHAGPPVDKGNSKKP